jgi:hypothetical protein
MEGESHAPRDTRKAPHQNVSFRESSMAERIKEIVRWQNVLFGYGRWQRRLWDVISFSQKRSSDGIWGISSVFKLRLDVPFACVVLQKFTSMTHKQLDLDLVREYIVNLVGDSFVTLSLQRWHCGRQFCNDITAMMTLWAPSGLLGQSMSSDKQHTPLLWLAI